MIKIIKYELHYKLKFYDGSEIDDTKTIEAAISEKSVKEKALIQLLVNDLKSNDLILFSKYKAILKKYDDVKEIVLTDIKTKKHNPFEAELRNEP